MWTMLISKKLNEAINAEIGRELEASNQYLNMAAYFDSNAYKKLAELYYKQSEEERAHAMRFLKYVIEAGGEVRIPAIAAPKSEFQSVEEIFLKSLEWEKMVTKYVFGLMDIAVEEKDYIAQQFLSWYANEQLEEESSMETLLTICRRVGEKNLIMLEAYLSHDD
jgi:bacterioferritin B